MFKFQGVFGFRAVVFVVGMSLLQTTFAELKTSGRYGGMDWLTAMIEAMESLNYQGTAVYLRDNRVETMKVLHAVDNGVVYERIFSLNDPMREVVRDAEKVSCYFPDIHTVVVDYHPGENGFLVSIPTGREGALYQAYALQVGEIARVAQRLTRMIGIDPVDDMRYKRKIWIDIESKLPLKHQVIGADGSVIEQMVFTELTIVDSIPMDSLLATTKVDAPSWRIRDEREVPVETQHWVIEQLPDGFKQVFYRRRIMSSGESPVEHMVYSDGFSSISVYVDETDSGSTKPDNRAFGAINSYSRKLNNYYITALGEAPAKTVRMMAEGVSLRDSER